MSRRHFASGLIAISLLACGDPAGPGRVSGVTKVTIAGSTATLIKGQTRQLSVTLSYDGATPASPPGVVWSSDSPLLASVNETGLVTAIGGNASVTIRAVVQGKSDSITFSVLDPAALWIYPSPAAFVVGESKALSVFDRTGPRYAFVSPPGPWASDHPEIISISSVGVATANATGSATITVSYAGIQLSQLVTVGPALHLQFSAVSGGPFPEWNMGFPPSRSDRNCGLSGGAIYCWDHIAPGFTPYDGCIVGFTQGMFRSSYCSTTPVPLAVNGSFVAVSMGDGMDGCGLTTSGDVYCFGLSGTSALSFAEHSPQRLASPYPLRAVFAASDQPCAISNSGLALCWGFGIGSTPKQISTWAWNTIASRGKCGINADSTAACWVAANGAITMMSVPAPYRWAHIDVSSMGACALAPTGDLGCWQFSSSGVPQPVTMIPNSPGLVSLGNMRTARYDYTQTCGLNSGGDMYCVTESSGAYSLQPLDLGVKLKSFSGNCGIGVDNKAYCWRWSSLKAVLAPGQ